MASKRFITVTAPKKIGTIGALPSAVRETQNRITQRAVVTKPIMGLKIVILALGRFIGILLCGDDDTIIILFHMRFNSKTENGDKMLS